MLGTGKHGFPEDLVLRVMRQEFEKFSLTYPQTTLKEIKLVRFDEGKGRTVQAQPARGAYSQVGRGNFTYLLEEQINFALKLSVGCLISQF